MREDFDARWNQLTHDVMSGMKEWRLQHPKATLREIETALDERLGKLRARMLTTHFDQTLQLTRSYAVCPECGTGFFPLDEELG